MGGFHKDALPHGYELAEYTIESMLGHGGFGITYLARDRHLDSRVAIKEYFPGELAVRQDIAAVIPKTTPKASRDYYLGLKNFIKEARALAHFKHPNIVRVLRYLEANDTAYMVMEYEQGESLADQLRLQNAKLMEPALFRVFLPILNGVRAVHEADMLHLDIKPENIYLRRDGSPMLIDFGSTRQTISLTMPDKFLVTHGYAPIEQYPDKGKQGPWTDIYALGASMYRCIFGKRPVNALERYQAVLNYQVDPLTPAVIAGKGAYSDRLLESIDWALQVYARDRPQSVRVFQDRLLSPANTTRTTRTTLSHATSTHTQSSSTNSKKKDYPYKKRRPARRGWVFLLLLALAVAGIYFAFEHELFQTERARRADTPSGATSRTEMSPTATIGEDNRTESAPATPALALRRSLLGHTGAVLSLAFSPDGRRIASAGADGSIRLWDSANGSSIKVLRGHQGSVNAVAFSTDGRWLASAGQDGSLRLWEGKTGAARATWRGPGQTILALTFSPDSRWLAAAGRDRVIELWSVNEGKTSHTYPGHHGDVLALAFSPDGRWLASGGGDRSVRMWNAGGTREAAGLSVHRADVLALSFSPDGRWLASGAADNTVRLVETGAGTQVRTFINVPAAAQSLAYLANGGLLAVGTDDGKIRMFDTLNGTILYALDAHQSAVSALVASPDGRELASAGGDAVIHLWKP